MSGINPCCLPVLGQGHSTIKRSANSWMMGSWSRRSHTVWDVARPWCGTLRRGWWMDQLTAIAQLVVVMWWRWEHPNEEKKIERKCFYAVFIFGVIYQGYKLFV